MRRIINLAIAALFLVSCGGDSGSVVGNSEDGQVANAKVNQGSKACRRAFSQTLSAVKDAMKASGNPLEVVPDKSGWVAACDNAGLSDEVVKCLDPKWFKVDAEACTETLKPHGEIKDELNKIFRDAISGKTTPKAATKKAKAEPQDKKNVEANKPSQPSDDVSGAVMDALKTQ